MKIKTTLTRKEFFWGIHVLSFFGPGSGTGLKGLRENLDRKKWPPKEKIGPQKKVKLDPSIK